MECCYINMRRNGVESFLVPIVIEMYGPYVIVLHAMKSIYLLDFVYIDMMVIPYKNMRYVQSV